MLEIFTGIVSGIVSGTGMGGGTILILILSSFFGLEQHIAQACNLVFFIPTSIVAIIVSTKQKLVNYKIGIVIIIFGTIGAIAGSKLASIADSLNLKKYFGIFLGFIAIYEILCFFKEYISKKKMHNMKREGEK